MRAPLAGAALVLALFGGCIKDDLENTACDPSGSCGAGAEFFCYRAAGDPAPRCHRAAPPDAGFDAGLPDDGTTFERAAASCRAIRDLGPRDSGVYYIRARTGFDPY